MSLINVLRKISDKKTSGFAISQRPTNETSACIINTTTNKKRYVVSSEQGENAYQVENNKYAIEPYIPLTKERFIVVLSGESGSGKGTIASILAGQYKDTYKNKQPIYYLCSTPKEHDINLNKPWIHQIPLEKVDEIDVQELSKSLVMIDDVDNSAYSKNVKRLMNKIVETGRKFNVSLLFISHINTHARDSTISSETDLYITNSENVRDNRMIDKYLHVPPSDLEEALQHSPAYIAINKVFRCIITDSIIYKY